MKFYDDDHEFDSALDLYGVPPFDTHTYVLEEDTFTIAQQEVGLGYSVGCLNFASHKRPGGGYLAVMDIPGPIKTQEEDLFRRSNLPELMDTEEIRKHYPLTGVQGLYCTATVSKNKHLTNLEPFDVGVITVPAVVNPQPDEPLVEQKILRILDIAADQRNEVLILGAWGCGIFNNDPQTIAELFMKHLNDQFEGCFKKVIFGVPGIRSHNYKTFREVVMP
jgi:uncharacterized protein (TIGR02452 family)